MARKIENSRPRHFRATGYAEHRHAPRPVNQRVIRKVFRICAGLSIAVAFMGIYALSWIVILDLG